MVAATSAVRQATGYLPSLCFVAEAPRCEQQLLRVVTQPIQYSTIKEVISSPHIEAYHDGARVSSRYALPTDQF